MNQLKRILLQRLGLLGIETNVIPGFVRSLAVSILHSPHQNIFQINRQLKYLGWDDFELDYNTMQLAIECFNAEGLQGFRDVPIEVVLFERGNRKPQEVNSNVLPI